MLSGKLSSLLCSQGVHWQVQTIAVCIITKLGKITERERDVIAFFVFVFWAACCARNFSHNFLWPQFCFFFVCLDPSQEFSDGPCLRWLKEINKDFFSLHFFK